jgi:hypothetical protein
MKIRREEKERRKKNCFTCLTINKFQQTFEKKLNDTNH